MGKKLIVVALAGTGTVAITSGVALSVPSKGDDGLVEEDSVEGSEDDNIQHPNPTSQPNIHSGSSQGTTSTTTTPPVSHSSTPQPNSSAGTNDSLSPLKNKAKNFFNVIDNKYRIKVDSLEGGADISTFSANDDHQDANTSRAATVLLGGYYVGKYSDTRSFLNISVSKKTYKGGKWKGTLTWFWSLYHTGHRNNKQPVGFVTFNEAKTSDTEKKLDLTGGFYLMHKKKDSEDWEIKNSKEVKKEHNKSLDKSNFDKYFPKPYWYAKTAGFHNYWYNNWGFMDGVGDLDKICGLNECAEKEESVSSSTLKWEWYGSSWYGSSNCDNLFGRNNWCEYVYQWSSDVNSKSQLQWFDYMYGNIGKWNLQEHLWPFYRGTWYQVK